MKIVKEYDYVLVDGVQIMIIGESWKGSPMVGFPIDILIIHKHILEKYRDKFLKGCNLSKTKIVYL